MSLKATSYSNFLTTFSKYLMSLYIFSLTNPCRFIYSLLLSHEDNGKNIAIVDILFSIETIYFHNLFLTAPVLNHTSFYTGAL